LGESLKKRWKNKVMHGQYIRSIDRQLISEADTFLWLLMGDLKEETDSEIVAAQNQVLQTNTIRRGTQKKPEFCNKKLCIYF
jgi:hypothetical protein